MKKHYTMIWNRKKACFVANVRKPNHSGWMKKWLPKSFKEHQSLDAESWLITWLSDYTKTNITPTNPQVSTKKTLAVYFPRWLQMRRKALGTSVNAWRTYKRCSKHIVIPSIQDLDLATELSQVAVLRSWIQGLTGAMASRLQVIATLSIFYSDAVAEGWLDENMANPIQKRALAAIINDLKIMKRKTASVRTIPWENLMVLVKQKVNKRHKSIGLRGCRVARHVRYLLAVTTGLRASEISALVWSDLHLDAPIPYVHVNKQLLWRGAKPWLSYEKELERGRDKLEIMSGEQAVMCEPKTYSSAGTVPLHPVTVEALKLLHSATWWPQADDPVFALEGKFYRTLGADILRKDLKRLNMSADKVTFHSIRRTFASKLAAVGVDDGVIERLLRHCKNTTARSHYIQDDIRPLYAAVCKLPLLVKLDEVLVA